MLRVYSGECCLCDVGTPVTLNDRWGEEKELHTGDIVLLWHVEYLGTDLETQTCHGMTVVVSDQHYWAAKEESEEERNTPWIMGIKSVPPNVPEWRVELIKKFSDVVDGEHWTEYGFNYREE